jgi:hypothetical protein
MRGFVDFQFGIKSNKIQIYKSKSNSNSKWLSVNKNYCGLNGKFFPEKEGFNEL